MRRIKFYSSDKEVIAVSSFAGKTIKGIARCNPEDTFSFETGKKLAEARCNNKIALKKVQNTKLRLEEALKAYAEAQKHLNFMFGCHESATKYLQDTQNALDNLLRELND